MTCNKFCTWIYQTSLYSFLLRGVLWVTTSLVLANTVGTIRLMVIQV